MSSREPQPYWKTKTLDEMSSIEWEQLCDGCGRCCLVKLEEEDTGETHFTDVACFMLDCGSCRCGDYEGRKGHVPDCVTLTPEIVRTVDWLPPTCAYKLVAAGKDLYWWHPLISGDPDTVHAAGVSVRGRVSATEETVPDDKLEDYIVSWPMKWPKGARR